MVEHVQLTIEGSTGRAVNSANTPCTDLPFLQERERRTRAAARIVLGMDKAGLHFATGQGQKLEARVRQMLESSTETPASIAALLKRYSDRLRYLKREQRRKGRAVPNAVHEEETEEIVEQYAPVDLVESETGEGDGVALPLEVTTESDREIV